MAITVPQLSSTISKVNELQVVLSDMRMLLNQAKELSDKNWQVDIGSRGSLVVTISVQQRTDMIALYDAYKAQLVTLFQDLP